ncbi:unnamed protein product [Sphagnum troendelagicum]|uniref:Uncharacterized protein n=1 Tax=Sphagnum troendelagicum TaxID=128251 RepID=A0ABP0U4I5_9BRYO
MTFMVVDTDSYDVLLGLDFLIKIGAIVDVERGLIQRVNSEAQIKKSTTTWQSASTRNNPNWVEDQDQTIETQEDTTSSSGSDACTNSSEHGEEGSSPRRRVDYEDEFGEDWMQWVRDAEQGRCTERAPDIAAKISLQRSEQTNAPSIPTLRQVKQIENDDSDHTTAKRLGLSSHEGMGTRWSEICQRIRINNSLDEGGQQQL